MRDLETIGRVLTVLCLLAVVGSAQIPHDDPVEAQKKWYDRAFERPDLIEGAFEVLRFPTGYEFASRYKHDKKNRKRILNPDFWCTTCAREKRIPKDPKRVGKRLMEREESDVLQWIKAETKSSRFTYIEDEQFKLFMDLRGVNLKEFRNPFLKEEMRELGDIFPKVTEKTVAVNGHQRTHLYLIRAHRLLRDFHWMTGIDAAGIREKYHWLGPYLGMKNKLEVYIFNRQRPYLRFATRYIGRSSKAGQCWHMFRDRCMIMAMHGQNAVDPQVANFAMHRITHNLFDAFRMYSFKLPAWFQMGMGHWIERRESVRYNSFCFSEGVIPKVLFETRWEPKVKKMIAKDRADPFVSVCSKKEYGEFPPKYHMITFSWVCYLWRLGPEKMPVFINALKDKKETETLYQAQVRAFRKAYNINLIQFDHGWREWVKKVYPDM